MSVKSPPLSASSQSETDLLGHLRKSGSVEEDVDSLINISVSSGNLSNHIRNGGVNHSNSTTSLSSSSSRNTPVPLPKPPTLNRSNTQLQQHLEKHHIVVGGSPLPSNSSNSSITLATTTTTTEDVDEILNKVLIMESNNLQLQQLEERVVVVQQPSTNTMATSTTTVRGSKLVKIASSNHCDQQQQPSNNHSSSIGDIAKQLKLQQKQTKSCNEFGYVNGNKNPSPLVYPPLPPVPLMVSSSLPPLPPLPSAPQQSYLTNSTPSLSSSISSTSSLTIAVANNNNNPPEISVSSSSLAATIRDINHNSTSSSSHLHHHLHNSIHPSHSQNQITSPSSIEQDTTPLRSHSSSGNLLLAGTTPIPEPESVSTNNSVSSPNGSESLNMSSLSPILKAHLFKSKFFTQPTRCGLCEQFMWGVVGKQGLLCKDCGFAAHKQCSAKISNSCSSLPIKKSKNKSPITTAPVVESSSVPINTNLEKELLAASQKIDPNNNSSISSSSSSSSNSSSNSNSPNNNHEIVNSSSFNLSHSFSTGSTPTLLNNSMSTSHIPHLASSQPISSTLQNSYSSPSPSSPATISDLSNSNNNISSSSSTTTTTSTSTTPKSRRSSVDTTTKEFQILFKSLVPLDEKVFTYYSCGYQGSVLKYGRLYLTEHYLCFYDNLVFDKSKQRQKVIPLSSIKSIEKKSGLAPNGIFIKTEERDYQFCLFIHKDEAFEIIEALLLHQEKQLLSQSITQKNVDGLKQALNQRKSRELVTSNKPHRKSRGSSSLDLSSYLSASSSPSSPSSTSNNIFNTLRSSNFEDPPLISVIKSGETEMMQILLEYYTSKKSDEVNHPDKEGYTPLHVAVVSDIPDSMLTQLIRHPNTRVQEKNIDGNTPLHYFCQKYRSPECQKIAQTLIERGANVNEQNNNGETPLHKAIFNNSVRLLMVYVLLKNNANVNLVNIKGESALHYAVRLGRIDVLKTLITAGADPTLVSIQEKKTPLMLAEEPTHNVPEIIDLLRRLEIIINSLVMCNLTQFRMALILEELSQEGSLSRMDDSMMVRIGCYDEAQKKVLMSLKNKRIPSGTTIPAITPGAIDLLKELENMDIKNGRWIIPQHELEYTDKIGSGISGKVYKGLYRGREVAIKVLKSADEAHNREEFLKEFHVLASLQSNMIVGLYGVVLEPRICLVMEYCSRGSLYQVLHSEKMTWERFFSFSSQLLRGISTLHQSTPQIVHRDVKSLNFLVTKDWRIKVADFGLSRFNTKSNQMTLNKTRGTSAYCAPEVFQGKEYSEKSDVYSLGVVFWELIFALINGRYLHPYGEYKKLNEFQIMLYTSNQNLRPTIPHNSPQQIKDLILSCWDKDIHTRPTCLEALDILNDCEKAYIENRILWDDILNMKDETSKCLSMDSSNSLCST